MYRASSEARNATAAVTSSTSTRPDVEQVRDVGDGLGVGRPVVATAEQRLDGRVEHHAGGDAGRVHAVHPDPVRGEPGGEGAHQPDDPVLARDVAVGAARRRRRRARSARTPSW